MGCPKNERVNVFMNQDEVEARGLGMDLPDSSANPAQCFVFGRTGNVQEREEELKYVVIYQPADGKELAGALAQLAQQKPPEPLGQVDVDFENAKNEPFTRVEEGQSVGPRMCCKCNRNVTVVLATKKNGKFSTKILDGTRFVKADGSPVPTDKCRKIETLILSTSDDILKDCDPPVLA